MRTSYMKTDKTDVQVDTKELNSLRESKIVKVVNCNSVYVREEPNNTAPIRCVMSFGDSLLAEDIQDGWAHVYTIAGIDGYVMTDFIKEG